MKTTAAKQLFTPENAELRFLPEGPYPLDDNRFSWVSIQHGAESKVGALNIYDYKQNSNRSYVLHGRPGFAFPTSDDNIFVVGCEREVGLFDIRDSSWKVLCDGIDSDCEGTIVNDGLIFENNLIFGTKDLEFKTKKASLYLFRMADRKLIKLAGEQICSNGKVVLKQDNGALKLLDIDTPTQEVVSYDLDIDAGKVSHRTVVVDCKNKTGFPDGMTICPEGRSVFISFYNPDFAPVGETRQFLLSDGTLLATYTTADAPQNTCPQLCLLDGKVRLIITTAIEHMPQERQSKSAASGAIFVADTDFRSGTDCPRLELS